MIVSIPQAVSTIAIDVISIKKYGKVIKVSIPQAVSTIAITILLLLPLLRIVFCFNTASGKYYCNAYSAYTIVAHLRFNTASGKYYCN